MRCLACGAPESRVIRGKCHDCGHVVGAPLTAFGFEMGPL